MSTTTQPRRRARNVIAEVTANQYTALISDLDSDSDTNSVHSIAGLSDTDSEFSAVNHLAYQAAVLEDQRIFEETQLGYIQEEDSDDDSYDDKATMIITPEALKALCSPTLTPLKEWNTNQVQQVKISLINGLIRVPSELHDNGHGYVVENEDYFRERMGDTTATLPMTPIRPTDPSNHKKYRWETTIYNTYMDVERAVIVLLLWVFPNSLVGKEVMPGLLPPNMKSKDALKYIQKMAKDPRNDHDATLTLKESASKVRHTPSAQGCTMSFQDLEMIRHKLAEAPADATFSKLELTKNEIMHFIIKLIRLAGYYPHNLDSLEQTWATEDKEYTLNHTLEEAVDTKYQRFKDHCIITTSSMYNRGDKGGNNNTSHHANMVSDQVTAQIAALAERNDDLEDNQLKLNDAFAQMTRGGVTIGGDGGIPPVIDTKSMGTAPTEDYSSFMAQQSTQMTAMQALVNDLTQKLASGGGGGGDTNRTRNNNKTGVSYWRQWNKYCHSCGVALDGANGCGTGGSKDCYRKKDGHKDAATFTNKLGGNTKRDHLWKLWCEPVTNKKFTTLPAGAKTTK